MSDANRESGARTSGAVSARPPEAVAFEREFPGARWLAVRVIRELQLVGVKADALVAEVARRYGLSHAALNALAVIEAAGGPLPTGEISAKMHISTATMTSILDTLQRKGHIYRQPDPGDRRRVLVDITPQAQALLDQLLPEVQQYVTAAFEPLGDQALRTLLSVLAGARDALDNAPRDLPPPVPRQTPPHLLRT